MRPMRPTGRGGECAHKKVTRISPLFNPKYHESFSSCSNNLRDGAKNGLMVRPVHHEMGIFCVILVVAAISGVEEFFVRVVCAGDSITFDARITDCAKNCYPISRQNI